MNVRGTARRAALHATLLTAGIGQPMLQLYGSNLAVFTSARMSGTDVVAFALMVLLAPVVLVVFLDVIAGLLPPAPRDRIRHFLVGISSLPLGLLIVRSIPGPWVVPVVLAVAIASAVAVLHARVPPVRTWLAWMTPLVPAVFALFVVSSQTVIWEARAEVLDLTPTTTAQENTTTPRTDPGDVSVLWLQLDEAPLWPLLDSAGSVNAARFPGFAALAENSTWYRNALGLSQTTVDAVPATLTGKKPVTGKSPTYSNYRKNLFALMYGHRALDVHEMATALCPKEACATVSVSGADGIANGGGSAGAESTTTAVQQPAPTVAADPGPDVAQFFRDAVVVLGHKLVPKSLRDGLPAIDEGWGGFGADAANDDTDVFDSPTSITTTSVGLSESASESTVTTEARTVETKKNTVRGWERDGAKSQVPVVRDMVARAARSSLPTLHFAHVLLPHRPWQLTPDLRTTRFVATDKRGPDVEDRVRDEYQAFLAQYAATDRVILDVVTAMKKSANWDRTMIIVTADHGLAFEPGESKRKDINPRRRDTLEEIYRVPLFVKWPDQHGAAVDDCAVQAFDIMPMVVTATGMDAGWEFDGTDVRAACPSRPVRTIWWDKGSTTLTSGFDAARSTAERFDQWVDADSDVDGIAKVAGWEAWFDMPVPSAAEQEMTVRTWTVRDAPLFTNVSGAPFARVPLQIDGTITLSGAPGRDAVGLVVMENTVVAVIPEIADMQKGRNAFRTILLPSSLTTGRHQPVLYVGRGDPTSPRVTVVAPPG